MVRVGNVWTAIDSLTFMKLEPIDYLLLFFFFTWSGNIKAIKQTRVLNCVTSRKKTNWWWIINKNRRKKSPCLAYLILQRTLFLYTEFLYRFYTLRNSAWLIKSNIRHTRRVNFIIHASFLMSIVNQLNKGAINKKFARQQNHMHPPSLGPAIGFIEMCDRHITCASWFLDRINNLDVPHGIKQHHGNKSLWRPHLNHGVQKHCRIRHRDVTFHHH